MGCGEEAGRVTKTREVTAVVRYQYSVYASSG
jgi:hypothetical protein